MSGGSRLGAPRAAWASMIADYLTSLAANGQRAATIKLRRDQLALIARGLDRAPAAVTAEDLVNWFGRQTHWAIETRRSHRAAAKGFFTWAYRTRRVSVYLGDELPKIRQPKGVPQPASDQAWRTALMAADWRLMLAIRLAGEAGLRRAEVAVVHTRDLIEGVDGAQLLVHGKGGKKRVVPISGELAALIRQGIDDYLFAGRVDGHISGQYLGELVSAVLPDGCTMHKLRHRYASRAYRSTRNLRAVQVLLGHESIATTERYTAVDDAEIRATAAGAW